MKMMKLINNLIILVWFQFSCWIWLDYLDRIARRDTILSSSPSQASTLASEKLELKYLLPDVLMAPRCLLNDDLSFFVSEVWL